MPIVKCDGSTCKHHRWGKCNAEEVNIRNEEIEFGGGKYTDFQDCKTYEYSKDWRQYDLPKGGKS
jgi:hypothetical protein